MQVQSALDISSKPRRRVLLALAWYSVAIHRGITRFAHDAGWIVDGGYVRGGVIADKWRGQGVIAVLGVDKSMDATVKRMGVPVVNVGYNAPPGVPSVASDSAAVGRMAAEHFISRGFRHFAFFETRQLPGEVIRRDGFEQTLKQAGYEVHRIGLPTARLSGMKTSGLTPEQIVGRQLMALPKPVAVTAEYDDLAIEVIDAALAAGLRVPEQVAVLGVDNDDLLCPLASVPLSSIDNDEDRIGYEAGRLLERILDGETPPDRPVLIPPRSVIVRQSTNILAIPHEHVAGALKMIWEHYTEPIDATRVAAEIPLSYTQLHESFVRYVGHSMAEELERRRVEHAQRLLASSDLKMTEVARRSGFGSADRMGRVFMRKLNTTPSDFRNSILTGKDVQPSGNNPTQEQNKSGADRPGARPAAFHQIRSEKPRRSGSLTPTDG